MKKYQRRLYRRLSAGENTSPALRAAWLCGACPRAVDINRKTKIMKNMAGR
jgi:hypothetical protein